MERAVRAVRRKEGRRPATASASATAIAALAIAACGGWADLPEGPLLLVFDHLASFADLFAVAAVCSSWRAIAGPAASAVIGRDRPPLLLSPVLVPRERHPRRGRRWVYPRRCRFLSPADPAASYRCFVPAGTLASSFLGYSHGQLIFYHRGSPLLVDFARGSVLQAPDLPPDLRDSRGVLTAPLSDPDCSLLMLRSDAVLLRWRVGESEWSKHPLIVLARHQPLIVSTRHLTVFRGQIFTYDSKGRLFKIEFSPHYSVRNLTVLSTTEGSGPSRVAPFPFAVQLVECGGELLLVRFVCAPAATTVVEVFRLDFSGPLSWVKVESLGETALFIDIEHGSSTSCPNPSRWGGRSNCIYLASRASDTWTVLPLDGKATGLYDHKLPPYWTRNSLPKWPSPVWVYPSMLY